MSEVPLLLGARKLALLALRGSSAACVVTGRFSALTMPVVTVPERPSGLPIGHDRLRRP